MRASTLPALIWALALACSLALPSTARAAEGDERPFDPVVAGRYQEILERDPSSRTIFQRLVELYGRGPGLRALIEQYRQRVDGDAKGVFAVRAILGHLYRYAGKFDEATIEYKAARDLEPESPVPVVAMAELARRQRDPVTAATLYGQALKLSKERDARESILTLLAEMALDVHDIPAAREHLTALKAERRGDPFVRVRVAELLARNGAPEEALAEWRGVKAAARGNAAEVVRALKEIAALLAKLERGEEAERALDEALSLVAPGNWNIREIRHRLVTLYRKRDDLRTLISRFQRSWKKKGFDEWLLLARLHDEVGREEKAAEAYKRAISANPRDEGARFAMIQLYERLGRMDAVVAQYKKLIAAFPRQTRHQLELADLHFRRQEPRLAFKLLDRMAKRHKGDVEVLGPLADAYTRYGENERALKTYQRLVRIAPRDETFLISLGEQHWLMGDADKANETWRKILRVLPDKAEAWHLLAETFAGHDLLEEALPAYKLAVEERPVDPVLWRSLALAHERGGDRMDSIEAWERVHALTEKDPRARREARGWIVRLYLAIKRLRAKAREYASDFAADPPDLEAGHLLGESRLALRELEAAEEVYRRLLELAPSDIDALEALEELYLNRNQLEKAIEVLTRIAEINPYRAKEFYQRVADFSLRLYQDDEAVRFAGLAVDLNPEDSKAHARLARIFYRMQDLEAAAREYRKAVQLDRLNFDAAFDLARVLRDLGRLAEADALYGEVIRRAVEDDLVLKAGRKSLHLNLMANSLEELERELLPLLWRTPPRPVFRRLVTELYGHLIWPITNQIRFGRPADARAARARLEAVGQRAVKPLLDALTDEDPGLRMSALDVLADLGDGDAAIPLGQLMDERDALIRLRAAVSLGRIADPRGVDALSRGIKDGDRGVRMAAAWALGRIGGSRAADALLDVAKRRPDPQWGVRVLVATALGESGDARAVPVLMSMISAPNADSREQVRAAAAWALGRRADAKAVRPLLRALELDTLLVRKMAALALGPREQPAVTRELLRALWTNEPSLRAAALWALSGSPPVNPVPAGAPPPFIHLDDGKVVPSEHLDGLAAAPTGMPTDNRFAHTVARDAGPVRDALEATLASKDEMVLMQVLRDLDRRPDGPGLGPLSATEGGAAMVETLRGILAHPPIAGRIRALAASESPKLRRRAISVLGKLNSDSDEDLAVLRSALDDQSSAVRRAALSGLSRRRGTAARAALERALGDPSFQIRAEAASAYGRLGEGVPAEPLILALSDPFAYVRESAALALGTLGDKSAVQKLLTSLQDRAAPVRAASARTLGTLGDASVVPALEALRSDHELQVRAAARQAMAELQR
jgi:HEAT repeat protein/tetratricopeptide (TPR) repeat protein